MSSRMRITDSDDQSAGTFFRCLHDEKPDGERVQVVRREWVRAYRELQRQDARGR